MATFSSGLQRSSSLAGRTGSAPIIAQASRNASTPVPHVSRGGSTSSAPAQTPAPTVAQQIGIAPKTTSSVSQPKQSGETKGTLTGYNPATGVQEGVQKPASVPTTNQQLTSSQQLQINQANAQPDWNRMGGTRTDMNPTISNNPFAEQTMNKSKSFAMSDIWGTLNPWAQRTGGLSSSQILESRKTSTATKIAMPVIEPLIGSYKQAVATRKAGELQEYNLKKDIQSINVAAATSSNQPGAISTVTTSQSTEKGFFPGNLLTFKSPFKREVTTYNTAYNSVDFEKFRQNLISKNIALNYDTQVNTSSSIVGDTTYTTTTTSYDNLKFSSNALNSLNPTVANQLVKTGTSKTLATTGLIAGGFSEGLAKGATVYGATTVLGIPAGIEYTSVALLGNTGSRIVGSAVVGGLGLYEAGKIGMTTYSGYQEAKQYGISPTFGAISSGLGETSKTAGFWIGVSGGTLSPVQIQPIVTNKATGESTVYSLGIVNPLGRSGKALVTSSPEGLNWGSFKPLKSPSFLAGGELESANQLGLQVLKQSIPQATNKEIASGVFGIAEKSIPKTNRLTSPGKPTVDITETKGYQSMSQYPQLQSEFKQFFTDLSAGSGKFSFKGLGTAVKEEAFFGKFSSTAPTGLERGFGSTFSKAEKGIIRQPGDIDFNVFGKVQPKVETFVTSLKARKVPGAELVSADAGKVSFKGTKIFEGFGQDTVRMDASPLGYSSQYPTKMILSTGGDVAGQKLGETLTQRFSTILTIKGEQTGIAIGARAGQEKAVADIYKMLGRSAELTSGKKSAFLRTAQEEYGQLAKKINPNIDLESGTIKTDLTTGRRPSIISPPSSLFKSSTFSVSPSSTSISSVNPSSISSSIKSSLSSVSVSSVSSGSSSSSSRGSKSSISSVISSPSLPSSSTSTSSSSSSSSSSRSSSSSSSSSISSITYFPIPNIPGGDMSGSLGTRRFKAKRKLGYAPDYRSLAFGITGKQPKKLSASFGYGEQARPIVGKPGRVKSFLKGMDATITNNIKTKSIKFFKGFRKVKI